MTVREAFELAYGPIPENATIHSWHAELVEGGYDYHYKPTIVGKGLRGMPGVCVIEADAIETHDFRVSIDISLFHAKEFAGRFGIYGKKYDEVVKAQCP